MGGEGLPRRMNWLTPRRLWVTSVEAEADSWLSRHGVYAYKLAGDRAIDAYCLGDVKEQERWHEIRSIILDRLAPDATVEDIQMLLGPGEPGDGEPGLFSTIFDDFGRDRDGFT